MRSSIRGRVPVLAAVLAGLLAGCQPSGPEALVQGDAALRAGRVEEAIRLLELAASKLPADGEAWNRLGLAYHAAGRTTDAQKAYLRALQFNRNLFDVRFNLGELYLEQGQAREAEAEFRTYLNASQENAKNPDAWRGLGLVLLAQRQIQTADQALVNAVRLNPKDAEAWNGLGLTRVQGRRFREAYQAFQEAARIAPELASARLNLAVTAHQHLGDARAALQHYRDFLTLQGEGVDSESVRRVIRDLEVRLGLARPEPLAPTNPPPALASTSRPPSAVVAPSNRPPPLVLRSNPPVRTAGVVTTSVPVRTVVASNPPVVAVVRSNPPLAKPPEAVAVPAVTPAVTPVVVPKPVVEPPAEPLEVVRVEEEPPPRRAEDGARPAGVADRLAVPLPEVRPPETAAVAVTPPPLPPLTTPPVPKPEKPSPKPVEASEEAAGGKNGFWSKVNPTRWANPVKWFRRDKPVSETEASGSEVVEPPKPAPVAVAAPPPKPAVRVTPLPPAVPSPRNWPRYARANPLAPARGDRAAAEAEYQRGAQAHQRGDLAGAVAAYERAVGLDPSHFESQHNLAVASLQQGDLKLSLRAGELAAALNPASPNAHYNLAVALQRSRFPVDAAEELERVTQLRPDDPNAHLALATLYAGDLADPGRARPHYERVLALKPDHPQAENVRRWLERNPAR